MKGMKITISSLAMFLATTSCAFAGTTTKVYNSGILVLAFLGFCSLVVVIQMIPAMITLFGIIKGMAKKVDTIQEAKAEAGK
jgi:hypothetical protein